MKTDDASRFPFHRPMSINVQTTISDRVHAVRTIDRCPHPANLGGKRAKKPAIFAKREEGSHARPTKRPYFSFSLSLSLSLSSPDLDVSREWKMIRGWQRGRENKRKRLYFSSAFSFFGCGWKMIKGKWKRTKRKKLSPSLSSFRLPILMWKMIKGWQTRKRNKRVRKEKKTTLSLSSLNLDGK